VHHYRTALRAVVIGGGVLVYVQAAHPTGAWTLKVLGVVVLLLLVVELLARPPDESAVAAGPDGGPTASVTP
jgi:predicted phage tail protein